MDKAVSRTLFLRGWSLCSGLLIVSLIPAFLDAKNQGYYFTFNSIIAIQVFFELGLSQVLVYRFADLYRLASIDDYVHGARQRQLLYAARIIYRYAAIAFFLVSLVTGYIFFSGRSSEDISWRLPWVVLVATTSLNLAQSVKLTYLEAIGRMANVSVLRLKVSFVSTTIFVLVLLAGGRLWAACVFPAVSSLLSTIWIYSSSKSYEYRSQRSIGHSPLRQLVPLWLTEIFPMQWRISLSWISGYFIFQLFAPITFYRFGPIQAGKVGFVISIMASLLIAGSTFTSALAPKLSSLYSKGDIFEYNYIFDHSLKQSLVALILLTQLAPVVVFIPSFFNLSMSLRFLGPFDTWIYSLSVLFSGLAYCYSVYLRSQQKEPLLKQSILTAVCMVPALWIGSAFSLTVMLCSALAVSAVSFLLVYGVYRANRIKLSNVLMQ